MHDHEAETADQIVAAESEVERLRAELAAIDRALAGEPVPPDASERVRRVADAVTWERRCRYMMASDTPYPLLDVLERLAGAADHLLGEHNCDNHGWEIVGGARDSAREIVRRLRGIGTQGHGAAPAPCVEGADGFPVQVGTPAPEDDGLTADDLAADDRCKGPDSGRRGSCISSRGHGGRCRVT